MASKTVRKPSVTITSPGGKVSAEGVTFIAAVNSAPTVEVVLRRAKEVVVRPLSKDVIESMRKIQEARFEFSDGTPDTVVAADDGNGGKLTFQGFAVAPVLEQSTVSSAETVNVVGVDAFLNGLGLSIYQSRPDKLRKEDTTELFESTPSRVTGDIPSLMREVTEVLVKNLDPTVQSAKTEALKTVIRKKHEANSVALKVWYDILKDSNVVFPETWAALFKKHENLGKAIAERVKEMLQQRTNNFWSILNGLGAEFLFFYRPEMDGSSGTLRRSDFKMRNDAATKLDAGVTRFSATDGDPSMLPLAGVIIYGSAVAGLRKEEAIELVSTPVGQWPVAITPGYFAEMQAPAWLSNGGTFSAFAVKEVERPRTPGNAGKKKNLDPTDYKARRTGLEKTLEAVSQQLSAILQDFAEIMYHDMRLADSTATLEIPLDFTVKVGVRYRFSTGDGGGEFTGFVRALRHSLQLQGGVTLTSGTSLSLSHVRYD